MNTKIRKSDLFAVLNEAKNLKADDIFIPKNIFQYSPQSSIIGLSDNAIVSVLHSDNFYSKNLGYTELWNVDNMDYIGIESRFINPYLKCFSDSELIKFNKLDPETISNLVTLYPNIEKICDIDELYLEYSEIKYNDKIMHHGKYIYIQEYYPYFILPLIPMKRPFDIINTIMSNYHGNPKYENVVIDDPKFNEIMSLKASEGGRNWVPNFLKEEDKRKYVTTLTSNIFNLSKGDSISMSIYDDINFGPDYFLTKYVLVKPKKKIVIEYYILNYKV